LARPKFTADDVTVREQLASVRFPLTAHSPSVYLEEALQLIRDAGGSAALRQSFIRDWGGSWLHGGTLSVLGRWFDVSMAPEPQRAAVPDEMVARCEAAVRARAARRVKA